MSAGGLAAGPGALGRLHVLTDARPGRDPLPSVAGALSAAARSPGAITVQVRAKQLSDRALYDLALRVMLLCQEHGATCTVDDRPDVALAVGAAGTHLGAHDLPVTVARRLVGPGHALGGTAREPVTAAALVDEGADYLGVGPVFATTTKDGLPDPIGVPCLAEVSASVSVPVLAIGGVTAPAVPDLLAAGAWGIAVVTAVSEAADPSVATRALLAALAR